MKRKCFKLFLGCICMMLICLTYTVKSEASVVSNRLGQVRKIYKQGSTFNEELFVVYNIKKNRASCYVGGCNGLVAYTTMKVFHSPYAPGASTYKKVGSTANTSNASQMKALFKKAKVGDVVVWSNGDTRRGQRHAAIFLSSNARGINVYEANFGSKNKVWYNHLWRWENMKSWANGAKKVNVFRFYNYNKVNKKKAAKNYKVGAKFEVNGIKYKVVNNSINKGKVKVIGYDKNKYSKKPKMPKAIAVNKDHANYLNKNTKKTLWSSDWNKFEVFTKNRKNNRGEQFFKVVK